MCLATTYFAALRGLLGRMSKLTATGGCRCAECRYILDGVPFVSYGCHCKECQKLTGSAFLMCMQIPAESLKLISGSPSISQRKADSGNILQTYFCGRCSSTLFAENSARPCVRTLHIGTLDEPDRVEVKAHIWVKNKLPWVQLRSQDRVYQEAGDWIQDYATDPERYGK